MWSNCKHLQWPSSRVITVVETASTFSDHFLTLDSRNVTERGFVCLFVCLLVARLGQYCFARWRLLSSVTLRAAKRAGGQAADTARRASTVTPCCFFFGDFKLGPSTKAPYI